MRILLSIIISLAWMPLFSQNSAAEGTLSHNRKSRGVAIFPFDSQEGAEQGTEDTLSTYYRALSIESSESGAEASFGYLNSWIGRQTKLIVESAPQAYELYINGKYVAYAPSGATPSEFNITRSVESGRNTIEFKYISFDGAKGVEGWSSNGSEKMGEAYIISQPTLHISDIFQRTTLSQGGDASAMIGVALQSTALGQQRVEVYYQLLSPQGEVITQGMREAKAQMRGGDSVTLSTLIPQEMLWSSESPTLYRLNLRSQRDGRKLEHLSFEVGFRTIEWSSSELSINGERVEIRAKRVDANISIEELEGYKAAGFNTFIIGAGRYNASIYHWADKCGAYLIPTAAINSSNATQNIKRGGNPTNDTAWRELYIERADDIYSTTQAHPSVVGFAIAESSLNGDNLYQNYLHLKSKGDYRPIIYLDGRAEWNNDNIIRSWE